MTIAQRLSDEKNMLVYFDLLRAFDEQLPKVSPADGPYAEEPRPAPSFSTYTEPSVPLPKIIYDRYDDKDAAPSPPSGLERVEGIVNGQSDTPAPEPYPGFNEKYDGISEEKIIQTTENYLKSLILGKAGGIYEL